MGLLSFFSTKPVKAFAEDLAEALARDVPVKHLTDSKKLVSANRISTFLERSYAKAVSFQEAHGVNGFQRAYLANTFRWKLADLGYPKDFVDVATEGLVIFMAKTKQRDSR